MQRGVAIVGNVTLQPERQFLAAASMAVVRHRRPEPMNTTASNGSLASQAAQGPIAPVSLNHASRLVNHGPTVLISTAHAGRKNVMAAAWSMPVEFTPPRIAIVIDKKTWTCELALASGRLAINIPCKQQADLCYAVGSSSGRDLPEPNDKFAQYGIASFDGPELKLPLVAGCVGWLECKLLREPHTEKTYDTFFVEVVSALSDPRVFVGGRWTFSDTNTDLHTLHHLGGGVFGVPSVIVRATSTA